MILMTLAWCFTGMSSNVTPGRPVNVSKYSGGLALIRRYVQVFEVKYYTTGKVVTSGNSNEL